MERVFLTDVCDIQYGYAFNSKQFASEGKIPLVRIRDVVRGYSETYTDEEFNDNYLVYDGDILIGMDGEFNIAYWQGGTAALNQRVCKLIPSDKVDDAYIFYFMSQALKRIENRTPFVTVKHLSAKELNAVFIDLPHKSEQELKGKQLVYIDKLIRKYEFQLEIMDELVKSRFVEMFGEPMTNSMGLEKVNLGSLSLTANNGMARRGNDSDGNIVLRLIELQSGKIEYSNPNRIKLTDKEKQRYLLRDKDFLFARVNGNPENVGRCAVFYEMEEPIYHNDHIIRYRFDEERVDGTFLSELLNSPYGKSQLKPQLKTSAGQYTVSQSGIDAVEILLPPLDLQRKFADFVAQADKSKLFIQQSIENLQTLKAKLMQEYFG